MNVIGPIKSYIWFLLTLLDLKCHKTWKQQTKP